MDGQRPIREICEKRDDPVQHHRASFRTVVTNYGYVLFVGRFFCKSIEMEFTNFYKTRKIIQIIYKYYLIYI